MNYTDWPNRNWESKDRRIKILKGWILINNTLVTGLLVLFGWNLYDILFQGQILANFISALIDTGLIALYLLLNKKYRERIAILQMEKEFD